MLLDTSVLIPVVRSKGTDQFKKLVAAIGTENFYVSRITELELLQGAKDETEWSRLEAFVITQDWVRPSDISWLEGARIYFDLRRAGVTIGSILDCIIAQSAIENGWELIHNDSDYEKIASVRELKQRRLSLGA